MGSKTINYKLNKPSYDDTVDIEHLNENAEIIDAALKGIVDEVSTKETPAGAQAKANTAESNAKSYTDAGLAGKVDISRVLTDVPANAKFTDTVYTHPSTHPASMIAESTTKRFVSDTEKSNWNDADSKKHTHGNKSILDGITQALIDAWNSAVDHISDAVKHITAAERTSWNTVTNKVDKVSGKGLSTEDYTTTEKNKLAGIEAGANNYTHPGSGTNPHGTTKADVGLSGVPNYGIATQAEAEAGTSDAKFMSPLKTKQAITKNLPTKVSQLENDSSYVTQTELGNAGYGDMMKSVYDTDNNGKIDVTENAEKLGGQLPAYYTKQSDYSAHNNDNTRHITAAERTSWNAKQNALGFTPENSANKGKASGYASLDANSKVPVSQLPSLGVDQAQFDGHMASFLPHGGFNFDTSFTYNAAGEITQIDAKQNNVLKVRTILNYTGEKLTSTNVKQYATDGTTVVLEYTDTIIYDGEEIAGVKRQVV